MFVDLSQDVRCNGKADLFRSPCLCPSNATINQFEFWHLGVVRLQDIIGNVVMSERICTPLSQPNLARQDT